MHKSRRSKSRWRGYIMMEAMFGGAIVATAALATLAAIGQVRVESIIQSREMIARDIALRQLEILRSQPFGTKEGCPSGPGFGAVSRDAPVKAKGIPGPASYTVDVSRQCVMERVTTATALTLRYRLLTATVTFETVSGPTSISASTRVYEKS